MQAWMSKHIKTQESSSKRHFVLSGCLFRWSKPSGWVGQKPQLPSVSRGSDYKLWCLNKIAQERERAEDFSGWVGATVHQMLKVIPRSQQPRRGGGLEALLVSHWYCGHMKRNLSIHYQKWSLYISAYVWEWCICLLKAVCRKCLACHVWCVHACCVCLWRWKHVWALRKGMQWATQRPAGQKNHIQMANTEWLQLN